jgi:ribose 5-phosphate isomerase B
MTIYIGADHRGFALKEQIKAALAAEGNDIIDVGAASVDPSDDYPVFARAVAEKVSAAENEMPAGTSTRGIVICGSGFGVDVVANKFKGVRSALAMSPEHVRIGRHDDDVNVLSIAADFIPADQAIAIARMFLSTSFEREDRYVRRLNEVANIEAEH